MINQLMPQGAPEGAPMGAPPPGPQGPPQPAQIDPAQLADARAHSAAMMQHLMALVAKPKGSLSKQDVFNAAADMIADGAFSTPQAKQQLVAEIAQMPDDESAIRQAIGGHLLKIAQTRDLIHQHFGAEG
jgi:hypothetical protein